jgi:UV DNA damage endonuclease
MPTREPGSAALSTWPEAVTPKIHFSSPRLDGREIRRGKEVRLEAPLLRQHADYVDPWTYANFVDELRELRFDDAGSQGKGPGFVQAA